MAEIEKPPPYPVTSTNPERSDYTCQPQQGHTSIPQGYHNVPTSGLPKYGSTVCVHSISQPQILVIGGCPACRVGLLEDEFTCLGICLAILFFPLGILCCLALKQRRCPNCGAVFG